MNENFLMWGAKGHAKVLHEIIAFNGDNVKILIDNSPTHVPPLDGVPILQGKEYKQWLKNEKKSNAVFQMSAIAAIGGAKGKDRLYYLEMFRKDGFNVPSLCHPSAYISSKVEIGNNCHICALSFLGVDVVIGDACIVNTKASIDHESRIASGVHLAPNVTLCGCVDIGSCSFIGAGSTILPNIKIGSNSIIGAGSIVTKDIPNNVLAYGNPAKIIKEI